MTAQPLPLKLQIGARTLFSIRRRLVRLAWSLDEVIQRHIPPLAALDPAADGYHLLSVPKDCAAKLANAVPGGLAFVRQRYTRYHVDLTMPHAAYLKVLSANTRAAIKRKARRLESETGAPLDVRRFRDASEMAAFHAAARGVSAGTYQEKLLGSGLPDDAGFLQRMYARAAADTVRGWLLYIAGTPVAYLYCPIDRGTVRYEFVGHDPAFGALSPGSVLLAAALADLFDDPAAERFDFTEGEGQHKRQFATGATECVDLLVLRPTIANRLTILALGRFDQGVALAKRAVHGAGTHRLLHKLRRA